jgi:RNA recognition motif-containing protein
LAARRLNPTPPPSAQTLSVRYEVHVRKGERAAASVGGGKAARVIVRNLNFKATVGELAAAFVAFGPLSEAHIPTVAMPKHFNPLESKAQSRGFGFVQFLLAADALAAAAASKQVTVCGREVTVALAQAKKAYDASEEKGSPSGGDETADKRGAAEAEAEGEGAAEDAASDEELLEEMAAGQRELAGGGDDASDDASNSDGSGVSDSDEEGAEGDKAGDAIDEAADAAREAALAAETQQAIAEARLAKKRAREAKGAASKDVAEGRTLFVKSLPFDTSEESLRHR